MNRRFAVYALGQAIVRIRETNKLEDLIHARLLFEWLKLSDLLT